MLLNYLWRIKGSYVMCSTSLTFAFLLHKVFGVVSFNCFLFSLCLWTHKCHLLLHLTLIFLLHLTCGMLTLPGRQAVVEILVVWDIVSLDQSSRHSSQVHVMPSVVRVQSRCRSFVCSFFAGRGPAYSGPQRWDHIAVQCACPGRGRELVGVCGVC